MSTQRTADRRLATVRLMFGSVLPAVFGTSIACWILKVEFSSWAYAVFIGQFIASMVLPYAVGWIRSLVSLVLTGSTVLWILGQDTWPTATRAGLSLAVIAGVAVLTWLSLRLGHVWKPADASEKGERSNPMFPYPYF